MNQKKTMNTKFKVLPDKTVTEKGGKYAIYGKPVDPEMIDQLAAEAETFKKSYLYELWSNHVRTLAIERAIRDSSSFEDITQAKAMLIDLDLLEKMMLNLINEQKGIAKSKK